MKASDSELLQRYVTDKADAAFAQLVQRHVDLVFSAALRQTQGDRPTAEDVTQEVFVTLSRKAAGLTKHPSLAAWLYTCTRHAARNAGRSNHRRQNREQQAYAMNELLQPEPGVDWEQLRPMLDDAMHALNESDRQAILLRYFSRLPLAEVGARLALSENTARMKVDRALDKLRAILTKQGFTSTAIVLGTLLSNHAVAGAPAGLAVAATKAGIAAGIEGGSAGLAALLGFKGLVAGMVVVAVIAGLTMAHYRSARAMGTNQSHEAMAVTTVAQTAAVTTKSAARASVPVPDGSPSLTLQILNAKNDKPISGVQVEYTVWSKGVREDGTLMADSDGHCVVAYPADTTNLTLITERNGFADTKLEWQPDRGEKIPSSYTLHPDLAAPIGGQVVDEQGQPIAGATVKWSTLRSFEAPDRISPESHTMGRDVSAITDAAGHWHINRLGDDVVRRMQGSFSQPHYAGALVRVGEEEVEDAASHHEQQLRDQSLVVTLAPVVGLTVSGTVTDGNGKLVGGAKILVGGLYMLGRRQTTSGADGTFMIDGCAAGECPVTATADGYAPVAVRINPGTNPPPLLLTLAPPQTMRLRVTGPDGAPVAGATVMYNPMGAQLPLRKEYWPAMTPALQAKRNSGTPIKGGDFPGLTSAQVAFRTKTGPDGSVVWTNAPSGAVIMHVLAHGYTAVQGYPVPADGNEYTLALTPSTSLSGIVSDAATGQPLPRFRIVQGMPDIQPYFGRTNIVWMGMGMSKPQEFTGGNYRIDLEEPLVVGDNNPGYVLKFEAPNYEPYISRIFQEGEGELTLDVKLHPAQTTIVTVLKPNGLPAGGADVGLVSPGSELKLGPGHFLDYGMGRALLQTGTDGRFRLTTDPAVTRIIIACSDGYLSTTPAELKTNLTVRLEQWGSIEGTCVSNGAPLVGQLYRLGLEDETLETITCAGSLDAYEVKTDAQGKFTIPLAPPGNDKLLLVTTEMGPNGLVYSTPGQSFKIGPNGERIRMPDPAGVTPVTVQPGETTTVTVQAP